MNKRKRSSNSSGNSSRDPAQSSSGQAKEAARDGEVEDIDKIRHAEEQVYKDESWGKP